MVRVEIPRCVWAAVLEYFVEALFDCRELVGLAQGQRRRNMRSYHGDREATKGNRDGRRTLGSLTIGMSSSDIGSDSEMRR